MTEPDPSPIYIYAVPHNEPCEAARNCTIRAGDTAYAVVSTNFGNRTIYCKYHWEERNL